MNQRLTISDEEFPTADRYYGRVDSIEIIDNQSSELLVQLDAVTADSFDALSLIGGPLGADIDRLPLAVLEFSTLNLPSQARDTILKMERPGDWLQVRVDHGAADPAHVDYYPGLFADGVTLPSVITRVDDKLAKKLSESFSLDDIEDAKPDDIADILGKIQHADFISVLDVGQGNCNALWRSGGGALLDFGGGVTANKRTFPKQPPRTCFKQKPPVVLSHWDWDHWSSAYRFPEARDAHWIVPRSHDLGANHRAFAWDLARRNRLHIWPQNMSDYPGPYFRIEKCTGYGRNDGGLAMVVYGAKNSDGPQNVLLAGDAAYHCIPSVQMKTHFGAVVASHHSGSVNCIQEVVPARSGAPLVYSVGHGNGYGHPRLHAELEYLQAGWTPATTFSTAQRVRRRPNSIAIALSASPVTTGCRLCDPKLRC